PGSAAADGRRRTGREVDRVLAGETAAAVVEVHREARRLVVDAPGVAVGILDPRRTRTPAPDSAVRVAGKLADAVVGGVRGEVAAAARIGVVDRAVAVAVVVHDRDLLAGEVGEVGRRDGRGPGVDPVEDPRAASAVDTA